MCGILLLLCFLTLTCINDEDNHRSTDNKLATDTTSDLTTGYDSSSIKELTSNNSQTDKTSGENINTWRISILTDHHLE